MKRNVIIVSTLLILLVSACAPQSTPTSNPVDVQSTAAAAAFTIIAQTQAAVPTATIIPPTEAPTQTPLPLPTDTPPSLPTLATPDVFATGIPTFTPQLSQGSTTNQDPCNHALGSWQGPAAEFKIAYAYKPRSKDDKVVLSLWVSSEMGECGYLADISRGPAGQYTAAAFVDGKKDFKVFGSFRITEGRWTIIIRDDVIVAQGSCYPNC